MGAVLFICFSGPCTGGLSERVDRVHVARFTMLLLHVAQTAVRF